MFKERVHKPFNKHVDYFCNEPVNHLGTVDFHKKKKKKNSTRTCATQTASIILNSDDDIHALSFTHLNNTRS